MENIETNINFQALFESAPGLFLVLKPDAPHFTIIAASNAYLHATMTERKKIMGRGLFEVFPDNPDDLTADGTRNLKKSLVHVLKNKTAHKMATQKYDIQRPESEGGGFEERHWSPANSPVLNKNNEVVYIIHRVEDITEFILLNEKAIEEINSNHVRLEKKSRLIKSNQERIDAILNILLKYTAMNFSEKIAVSEHADELDAIAVGLNTLGEELENHIKQVKDSNQQLQSVNKELESFSYSVSHDLRAPLRAIDGYAVILEEDYGKILDKEGTRLLEAVQYNAKKMGNLIDDLLDFSRLGKKELTKINLYMNELVEAALFELNKSIKHNAKVKIKYLYPAKGDYGLINQVVVNLLSNAIKYSTKVKEPFIEVSSEKTDTEIIYSIKDNGAGFDMKYVHKLFGVFQRLHTMGEFEGTGVGLAIVQKIMAKHGGKVWAEGKINEGAIFKFSLPIN